MSMTFKQRMLTALDGHIPDRLPVTTHFLMPQFLRNCMHGISEDEFFDTCGWDPKKCDYETTNHNGAS
jgi:hypothetical protein